MVMAPISQYNEDKTIGNIGLKRLLWEHHDLPHEILTKPEEMLVLNARRQLLCEINAAAFYSIICEELSDISKTN